MRSWLDTSVETVAHAMTGALAGLYPDQLQFKDATLDPWSPDAFTGTMPTVEHLPRPSAVAFVPGDDHADRQALAKGIDPHQSTGNWLGLAKSQLGAPYVWDAAGTPVNPDAYTHGAASQGLLQFDCSGFTQWLVKRVTGTTLAHHAATQAQQTQAVDRNQLQPGDLLFFSYGRLGSGAIDHVEVYMGGNKMIGTANPTTDLDISPVDWSNFVQGGRVPGMTSGQAPVPATRALKAAKAGNGERTNNRPIITPFTAGNTYLAGALVGLVGRTPTRTPKPPSASDFAAANGPVGNNPVALGQQMAAQRGWTGDQWRALYALWNRESSWDPNAVNDSSGATGIPQLLPAAHKLPANWSDPRVQIQWGLDYIAQRYGDPMAALAHSNDKGWY